MAEKQKDMDLSRCTKWYHGIKKQLIIKEYQLMIWAANRNYKLVREKGDEFFKHEH